MNNLSENGATPRPQAHTIIRQLLDGHAPAEVDPGDFPGYQDEISEMLRAHQKGGVDAIRQTFQALARLRPELYGIAAGDDEPEKRSYTMAELYATEFPEPKFAVPGILPVGLSILAARPKFGKSWFGLQVAHAVGTGGRFFDEQVKPGKVLYIALEDNWQRLKDRASKQQIPADANITYFTEWETLTGEGIPELFQKIADEQYTLIIIDTLSRAIGRADQSDGAEMTMLMGRLQRMVQHWNVSLLLIDHHRKSASNGFADPIDDIMGSTAKAGVVDAALGMYKQQGKPGATLKITGRDVPEKELALEWDAELFCWQCKGDAQALQMTERRQEILDALETLGRCQLKDIADTIGQPRSNTYNRLSDMVNAKMIQRIKERNNVYYELLDTEEEL